MGDALQREVEHQCRDGILLTPLYIQVHGDILHMWKGDIF